MKDQRWTQVPDLRQHWEKMSFWLSTSALKERKILTYFPGWYVMNWENWTIEYIYPSLSHCPSYPKINYFSNFLSLLFVLWDSELLVQQLSEVQVELFHPPAFLQILLSGKWVFLLHLYPSKYCFYLQKGSLLKIISNFKTAKFPPPTFAQLMRSLVESWFL